MHCQIIRNERSLTKDRTWNCLDETYDWLHVNGANSFNLSYGETFNFLALFVEYFGPTVCISSYACNTCLYNGDFVACDVSMLDSQLQMNMKHLKI